MATVSITPRDRLSFTLFLAASLHAAIILGVGFSPEDAAPPAPTIEVTLATHADQQAPERADFIAQANQQGSGTEAEVRETTTTSESDFQQDRINPVNPEPVTPPQPQAQAKRELLAAETAQEDKVTREDEVPVEDSAPRFQAVNYQELAEEIASLEARITEEAQALAKQPRVRRLTSVSTKSAVEAAYLNAWRQKVERIGNANYPAGGVYGDLRMLVVLRFDGTLEEVRILESSGHKVLDEAALRIVRLAAPYQDFPVEMRKKYDRLEIIRTWQFSRTGARLDT